jgi:hypothetical protein
MLVAVLGLHALLHTSSLSMALALLCLLRGRVSQCNVPHLSQLKQLISKFQLRHRELSRTAINVSHFPSAEASFHAHLLQIVQLNYNIG